MPTSVDAFQKLISFLSRLEATRRTYRLEGRPTTSTIRVLTWVANERWEVDFHGSGGVDIAIFNNAPTDNSADESQLERLFGRMRKAWQAAAVDLGIRFLAPFRLDNPYGSAVECAGYLPDFGGPKGTVLISLEDPDEAFDCAEALGYHTSGLNPAVYETYDRETFIETLTDWKYYGPAEGRPSWLGQKGDPR